MTRRPPPYAYAWLLCPLSILACKGDKDDTGAPVEASSPWDLPSVLGVSNMDDDDENGSDDWSDEGVAEDNDLSSLELPAELFDGGGQLQLALSGDTARIRIWLDGEILLDESTTEATLNDTGEATFLDIEFDGFLTEGVLQVSLVVEENTIEETSVQLLSAPLLVNHHLQWGEAAYALEDIQENAAYVRGFEEALGDAFTGYRMARYGYDVWVQDEFEFATLTAPGNRMDVVIDSVRSDNGSGLDDLPEEQWEAPDLAIETWRGQNRVTSQDSFGNLEVTPPVTVDGVEYPFGRVYWGLLNERWGIAPDLADLFTDQGIQDPFTVSVDFVCVGHVDEFSSWVPDPDAEQGFRLLISDTPSAFAFLETLDPDTYLPRYAADHGYDTVGEILDDANLRALNEEIQEDYLEPNLEIFMAEAGLTEDDVIRIRGIFEEYPGCGGTTLALIPGTINMEVYQPEGSDETILILPDPFLRTDSNDQSSDPFIEHIESLLPDNLESWWVDDWDSYHLWMGEVHCGSNTKRTPVADWWTDAAHLLDVSLDLGGE